jgi:hypothetical protein
MTTQNPYQTLKQAFVPSPAMGQHVQQQQPQQAGPPASLGTGVPQPQGAPAQAAQQGSPDERQAAIDAALQALQQKQATPEQVLAAMQGGQLPLSVELLLTIGFPEEKIQELAQAMTNGQVPPDQGFLQELQELMQMAQQQGQQQGQQQQGQQQQQAQPQQQEDPAAGAPQPLTVDMLRQVLAEELPKYMGAQAKPKKQTPEEIMGFLTFALAKAGLNMEEVQREYQQQQSQQPQ